jgi:hypothetical protein
MTSNRVLAWTWALALAACGGGSTTTGGGVVVPTAFASSVDHPYFVMARGRRWTLEGEDEGLPRREEVTVLPELREIARVRCTGLRQMVFVDGELSEVTTEWFAEDRDGNVWKFGEESLEWDGDALVRSDDSWIAGEDPVQPWVYLTAHPRPGDVQVGHDPTGTDTYHVVSVTTTAHVLAGTFANCLEVSENPDDPADHDIILYAPGIGRIAETSSSDHVELATGPQ